MRKSSSFLPRSFYPIFRFPWTRVRLFFSDFSLFRWKNSSCFQGTFFSDFFFVSGARFEHSRKLLEGFQRIVNSFYLEHFQSEKNSFLSLCFSVPCWTAKMMILGQKQSYWGRTGAFSWVRNHVKFNLSVLSVRHSRLFGIRPRTGFWTSRER